ncbi:MAG: hypothetical protein HOO93_03020 [Methyloglobulus sp.]|nr:hypothetical protein [Methyloglobulus sp.]
MSNKAKHTKNKSAAKYSITNSLIIHGGSNHICVDSRDIAKEFERRHDNVLQTIKNLIEDGTISSLFGDNYPVRFGDNYLDRLNNT